MVYELNLEQYYSHDATTLREDLHDAMTVMSPYDTPLMSVLDHVPVNQKIHQRLIHEIDYDGTSATAYSRVRGEGQDATWHETPQPIKLNYQLQIMGEGLDVARSDRVSRHAAIQDPYVYYLQNLMLATAKYTEFLLHFGLVNAGSTNYIPAAGDDQTTATAKRRCDGLVSWIAREGSYVNQTTLPTTGVTHPLGHQLRDEYFSNFKNFGGMNLERKMFVNDILAPAYRKGMTIGGSLALCSSRVKSLIADYAMTGGNPVNEREISADYAMIHDTIDYVRTQHGIVAFHLDRYMETTETISVDSGSAVAGQNYGGTDGSSAFTYVPEESIVVIEPQFWHIGVLDGFHHEPLAKIGDSDKGQVVGEVTLICDTPIAGTGGTGVVAPAA